MEKDFKNQFSRKVLKEREKALKNPDDTRQWYFLGNAAANPTPTDQNRPNFDRAQWDALAEEAFFNSLDIEFDNKVTLCALASLYSRQKRFALSEDAYFTALERDPNDVKTLTGLGHMYQESGQNDRALGCFERANQLANGEDDYITARLKEIMTHTSRAFYDEDWELVQDRFNAWLEAEGQYHLNHPDGNPDPEDQIFLPALTADMV
ncbi:MAG: tetratricopeptide repeat protein [Bdellovibrionales bacterium]